MLKFFYEFKSIAYVQSAFRVKYKTKIVPDRKVVINIVSVFEKTGTVAHMAPKRKEPNQKREDAKNQLETMATDYSTLSIRKAAAAVGVSPTLVYHILHEDLHVKPYKYQEWHKLEEYDYEKMVKFPKCFLLRPQN